MVGVGILIVLVVVKRFSWSCCKKNRHKLFFLLKKISLTRFISICCNLFFHVYC